MDDLEKFTREAKAVSSLRQQYTDLIGMVSSTEEVSIRYHLKAFWDMLDKTSQLINGVYDGSTNTSKVQVLNLIVDQEAGSVVHTQLSDFLKNGQLPRFERFPRPRDGNMYGRYV